MSLLDRMRLKPDTGKEAQHALRQHVLFAGMSDGEFEKFSRLLNLRKYEPGEVIYRKNYPQSVLFLIVSGRVELHLDESLDSPVIGVAEGSEYLGITELLTGTSRNESALARTVTSLYAISTRDFANFLTLFPKIGVKLLWNLGRELSRRLERIEVA
jgi:CRP-like cAMP-binding protein